MIDSVNELSRLLSNEDQANRREARFATATDSVWLQLLDQHPELKHTVLWTKTVPRVVLRLLAHDPDDDVRFSVAMKRKLDPEVFEQLSLDPCISVRHRIAVNAKTPDYILERLCSDEDGDVAAAARRRLSDRLSAHVEVTGHE